MSDYISREAAIRAIDVPNIYHGIIEPLQEILCEIPAADVAPVVRCKNCVYWQKPQIKLNDGTYRDYLPGEGDVTIDTGINLGSYCAKYDRAHINRIPQFMGPEDFCSKGYEAKMAEVEE